MNPAEIYTPDLKYMERKRLSVCEDTPSEILSQLCSDPHPDIRFCLAKRLDLLEADFLRLSETIAFNIRLVLTQNRALPVAVMRRLMQPDDIRILSSLAKHERLPPDLQMRLVSCKDSATRCILARNSNLCLDVMNALVTQDDKFVLRALARNPRTPPSVLHTLAQAGGWGVRYKVIQRTIRSDTLLELYDMGHCKTDQLIRHPCCPDSIFYLYKNHQDERIRAIIALNKSTPADLLDQLSCDNAVSVRTNVARNPNTPLDTLRKLTNDPIASVRSATLYNKNIPLDALVILVSDTDEMVRDNAARHRLISYELLQKLTGPIPQDDNMKRALKNAKLREVQSYWIVTDRMTPASTLVAYSKSDDESTLMALAKNPSCPLSILSTLSNDERRYVRQSVATNLATNPEILSKLAKDTNPQVRRLVGRHPLASEADLLRLSKDKKHEVRYVLTQRFDLSEVVLSSLLDDPVIAEWYAFNCTQHQSGRPITTR